MSSQDRLAPKSWCFTFSTAGTLRTRPTISSARLFLQPQSRPEVTEMNSRMRAVVSSIAATFLLPALLQAGGTVPKSTAISVVTDQAVSSKDAKAGQSVSGSIAKDVTVGGKVVIPKGAPVKLSVSMVQASGRLSTPAKLYLRLRTVTVNGKE